MRPQAPFFISRSIAVVLGMLGWFVAHDATITVSLADAPTKPERPVIPDSARTLTLKDIEGNQITPFAPRPGRHSILLFTATECPIANAFSPEIARIAREYTEKKCTVYLVYTDPELDVKAIQKHLEDYSLQPVIAILDKEQRLAQATGATHTPEASVIDSEGRQLYRGRLNNRYAALGKARRVITRHDLRQALQSIVAGKSAEIPRTAVIGCYIPTPPDSDHQ